MSKFTEITTEFLDPHNDHINIYVLRTHEGISVSDDGYTLADIKQSGIALCPDLVSRVKIQFGVQERGGALLARVHRSEHLERRKHNLLQAMIALFAFAEFQSGATIKVDCE